MTRQTVPSRVARLGLAPRLVLNNLLVILAGASTVLVTALLVGPAVFEAHLQSLDPAPDLLVQEHVARAFDESILVSLGVGILIAGVTAAALSWLVAKRLAAPVSDAAEVASKLADGRLEARVVDPRMGPEFATLTTAVNELAHRLETTEQVRRQLTGELAHQLRTPVASIAATIEAVRDGVLPVDEVTFATLDEQSRRLARLVGDIEVVSRAEERQLLLDPEPVGIAGLVDAAMAAHRERFRAAGVELSSSVAPGSPAVTVDPDRIQEVFGNLLDNALRHTPAGGTVTIATRVGEGEKRTTVIEVKDSGRGFPEGDAERIFHRFEKAPDSTGSGLGLTIARAIIEAQHGTLTARSDGPAEGACFTIVLPASTLRRRK
jgi:two-component system, OmpR family, sensor histidine kinase BaeS